MENRLPSLKQGAAIYSLSISYAHSQHSILITGTVAAPEFPWIGSASSLVLTWAIILGLTAALMSKNPFEQDGNNVLSVN